MKNSTRQAFDSYVNQIALLNGVASATTKFSVAPSVQQTLETKIQESDAFLKLINIYPVDEKEGEKIGLTTSGPVAGRTDTSSSGSRTGVDAAGLSKNTYRCEQTNSDTFIRYATLDAWAKFPDFQTRLRDALLRQQALDRIMIGWNGTSAAATTNKTTNPLLQDVNKGWLHHIQTNAPARAMLEGAVANDKIHVASGTVGTDVDYTSLDALAFDLLGLLDPWAREDPELVVLVGSDLLADKYFPMIQAAGNTATEGAARDQILRSAKQLGGKPAISVPYFPSDAMLVTKLSNLSIYWQDGTRRRAIIDNPAKDRIDNFESWNEAYVVEDYGFTALARNITMAKKAAG